MWVEWVFFPLFGQGIVVDCVKKFVHLGRLWGCACLGPWCLSGALPCIFWCVRFIQCVIVLFIYIYIYNYYTYIYTSSVVLCVFLFHFAFPALFSTDPSLFSLPPFSLPPSLPLTPSLPPSPLPLSHSLTHSLAHSLTHAHGTHTCSESAKGFQVLVMICVCTQRSLTCYQRIHTIC